jgi:hypothetical protein
MAYKASVARHLPTRLGFSRLRAIQSGFREFRKVHGGDRDACDRFFATFPGLCCLVDVGSVTVHDVLDGFLRLCSGGETASSSRRDRVLDSRVDRNNKPNTRGAGGTRAVHIKCDQPFSG